MSCQHHEVREYPFHLRPHRVSDLAYRVPLIGAKILERPPHRDEAEVGQRPGNDDPQRKEDEEGALLSGLLREGHLYQFNQVLTFRHERHEQHSKRSKERSLEAMREASKMLGNGRHSLLAAHEATCPASLCERLSMLEVHKVIDADLRGEYAGLWASTNAPFQ